MLLTLAGLSGCDAPETPRALATSRLAVESPSDGTDPVRETGPLFHRVDVQGTLLLLDSRGVWKRDGTGGGTVRVKDLSASPSRDVRPVVVGSTLYFLANGESELWKSDGTSDGTLLLRSFHRGALRHLTPMEGALFFTVASSTSPSRELWRSDGSTEGTARVSTVSLPEAPSRSELVPFNGAVYFEASDGRPWRTDGVETAPVRTASMSAPSDLGSDDPSMTPNVALTSPAPGSFLRGGVMLEASATATLGVARVEFYDGATLLGTDYASPYTHHWNTGDAGDGARVLTAKAFDLIDQVHTSAGVEVTVDNTVPQTALVAPAHNAHLAGSVQLGATASDNLGVAKVEFYDGPTLLGTDYASPYELTWNTASAAGGAHVLTTRAFDFAGNVITSADVGVTVDNTAPTAALSSPAHGAQLRGFVPLSAIASDNQGVARVEFHAGATLLGTDTQAPYELSWNTAGVPDGVHALTVKAYDLAGNSAPSAAVEVLVDNTAPAAALDTPVRNAWLRGVVPLSATASDNVGVAGVEFYDGPTLLGTVYAPPYALSWNTADVSDGLHVLTVRAFDTVGNVGTSAEVAVTVDNTAPMATLSPPAPNAWLRGVVSLGATASDNGGVARVEFYADGALLDTDTSAPYELSWDSASVTDGIHHLSAMVYDLAGNSAPSAEVEVTVDNSAPTTAVSSPARNTRLRRIVQVSATASDNLAVARVEFHANGVLLGTDTTAPYDVSWDTATGPDGTITLTTRAYDAAGNVTVSADLTVLVDNTAPTVAITSPANGATLFLSTTIEASADDNVGVTQVVFYDGTTVIGTDTTAPYSVSWDLLLAPRGSHTLTAQAHDATGNVTTSEPVTVTVN